MWHTDTLEKVIFNTMICLRVRFYKSGGNNEQFGRQRSYLPLLYSAYEGNKRSISRRDCRIMAHLNKNNYIMMAVFTSRNYDENQMRIPDNQIIGWKISYFAIPFSLGGKSSVTNTDTVLMIALGFSQFLMKKLTWNMNKRNVWI